MSSAHGYPRWQTAPPDPAARRGAEGRPRRPCAARPPRRRAGRAAASTACARRRAAPAALRAPAGDARRGAARRGRGRPRAARWCWPRPARARRARSWPRSPTLIETGRAARVGHARHLHPPGGAGDGRPRGALAGADLSAVTAGHLPLGLPAHPARYGPAGGPAGRRSRCSTPRTRRRSPPWPATRCSPAARAPGAAEARGDRRAAPRSPPRAAATLEDVVLEANPRLGDRLEDLEAIADGYAERKRAMAAVDYADLLVLTLRLLDEQPARAASACPRSYRWVLVDELHDVNPVQARLRRVDRGRRGQPDRGRRPRPVDLLLARRRPRRRGRASRRPPGARVFPLQTNYRSSPEVVALAQATLPAGNPYEKRLRAQRPASGERRWWRTWPRCPDEARFVVQRIADLITAGRAPGRDRGALPRPPPLGRPPARPGGGRRRVRALLRRALRRERPRQGRAGLLPAAPQPARRAGLAPRAAPVRPRGRGGGGAGLGGASPRSPTPSPPPRRCAPSGPGAPGLAPLRRGGPRHRRPSRAPRRSCCGSPAPTGTATTCSARTPTGATARATWRGWPSSRPAHREPRPLPRRPPARRAGRGRRGRVRPGAPGRAVERPPGEGPRVAGRVRAPGRAGLVPLGMGGQRGQPRRGGAPLLRRGHAGRRRALPLPARSPRGAPGTPAPTRWC